MNIRMFLNKYRRVVLALIDCACVILSGLFSQYLIRYLCKMNVEIPLNMNLLISTICVMLGLFLCGVYRPLWRYATLRDLLRCILGVAGGSLLSFFLVRMVRPMSTVYWVVDTALIMALVLGSRIGYKSLRDMLHTRESKVAGADKKRTLIVGAGSTCRVLLTEMAVGDNTYLPVAAIDDDPAKIGCLIKDIPIHGPMELLPEICEKYKVDTILVAIPSCTEAEQQRILSIASQTACHIKVIPFLHDLVAGSNLLNQAHTIRLEDLLGRDPISFNQDDIQQLVCGKVCMVTGGGGSIGSELCRQIMRNQPKQLVIVDIYENNAYSIQQELLRLYGVDAPIVAQIASVRDYQKMTVLFDRYRPQLVFHAAAHKHVPLMETAPEEAVKNNIIGTFHVATLAEFYRAEKFVMISTDKAVNPTNVMGATKRCCEMLIQSLAQHASQTEFVTVRFGNVLGSNGSVIPLFRRQIEEGGPVTVTHPDIIRYFMTIPEAVSLVLQAGAMAHGGEIFVLDMGKPVKITTLAENLIRLYGYRPGVDIKIEFTGLRPGEKLFEELLMDEEGLKSTANKKIFIGNQLKVNGDAFLKKLVVLKQYAMKNDSEHVLIELRDIVPTFQHNADLHLPEQPQKSTAQPVSGTQAAKQKQKAAI